ncbi:MAG: 4-hydroxy-2-oxoheptanedioate aldolase [Thermomicrobiales bacterium]|nr:4-hydroxy-2-oxoheptanedioate aldolase [Thermomicrobiales bacterium]
MRPNRVKALWREGKAVRAAWTLTGDPLTVEILANAGFDAVLIDMQHGFTIGPERVGTLLQVISTTSAVPMVRVPWNDPVHMQYVLDAGAYGVIVPLVNTPEEAARAAGACRYPPLGYRSMGPNRVEYYAGDDYVRYANDEIICLVMIEHIDAVGRIDEIARVPGIDGFFIGPGDLAMSLGLPPGGGAADERFQAACRRVLEAAQANGLVAGIAPLSVEDARRRVDEGFAFCPFGNDWLFLLEGAEASLRAFGD